MCVCVCVCACVRVCVCMCVSAHVRDIFFIIIIDRFYVALFFSV